MSDIYEFFADDDIVEEYIYENDISRDYEYIGICANIGQDEYDGNVFDMIVLVYIRIDDGVVYLINNPNIGYEKYKENGRNIDMIKNVFKDTEDMINSGENFGNIYGLLLENNKYDVFQAVDYEEIFEIDFDEEFFNNPEVEEIVSNTKYIFNDDFIENINLILSRNARNNKIEASISFGICDNNEDSDIEEN